MPGARGFQARPDRGEFVALSLTLDRGATYNVFAEDAAEEGVPVEVFIARHLAKCAGTFTQRYA